MLAEARAKAVPHLTRTVEQHLQQLHMPNARLKVAWTALPEPGPDGLHELRLHAQTNPGEGFHPLDRIASGGELSRLLLAIKPAGFVTPVRVEGANEIRMKGLGAIPLV